ncbi:MAG TPA: hypothetical protein VGA69_10945 [Nitriliruptorales bacterium]
MLIAFAIALLVGAAIFLGGRAPQGRSQLVALYEGQDVEAIADAVLLESLPGVTRDQVVQVFGAAFQGGVGIASQRTLSADGQRLTEIVTDNGLRLCERPDGRVLINCRVGQILYEPSGGPDGVTVDFAGAELLPGEAHVQLVLVGSGPESVMLPRGFSLSASGEPLDATVEVSQLGQLGVGPPIEGDVEIPPGGAVLLSLRLPGDQLGSLLARELTVEVGGEPVTLVVADAVTYLE